MKKKDARGPVRRAANAAPKPSRGSATAQSVTVAKRGETGPGKSSLTTAQDQYCRAYARALFRLYGPMSDYAESLYDDELHDLGHRLFDDRNHPCIRDIKPN